MKDNEILQHDPVSLANVIFDEQTWFGYNNWLIKRYAIFLLTLNEEELKMYLKWTVYWEAYEISCYIRDYLMVIEENRSLLKEDCEI